MFSPWMSFSRKKCSTASRPSSPARWVSFFLVYDYAFPVIKKIFTEAVLLLHRTNNHKDFKGSIGWQAAYVQRMSSWPELTEVSMLCRALCGDPCFSSNCSWIGKDKKTTCFSWKHVVHQLVGTKGDSIFLQTLLEMPSSTDPYYAYENMTLSENHPI